MPNMNILTTVGLHTFQNQFSSIPQGALIRAENVSVDRDGIIEPSRGFTQYTTVGTTPSRPKQCIDYKSRLLVHYDNAIAYDNGSGTMTALSESYTETTSGLRVKSIEFNGSLYLTSSTGIRKIATTSSSPFTTTEEDYAGGVRASDLTATPDYTSDGFLTEYSKVAYRVIWLKRDINSNLIIGYPSARYEVVNASNLDCQVTLNITIPPDITSDYFFQIYRTSVVQSSAPMNLTNLALVSPNEEYNLVYEAYPSATDLLPANRFVEVTDIVTEDYRNGGAFLYTNELSGAGMAQANYRPPFAYDIALYKNTLFFANTKTYHSMSLALTGLSNMVELPITGAGKITYSGGYTTITTDTAHGLVSISNGNANNPRFVLKGVEASNPNHYLNATWQMYDSPSTTQIRFVTTDWTADAIDATSNAAIYTSYLAVSKTTTERYFFVGRSGKVSVVFPHGTAINDSDYFKFTSTTGIKYYAWYEKGTATDPIVADSVGIKVSFLNSDTDAQVAQKTLEAIAAASYEFDFSIVSGTLTFISVNSGYLDSATFINGVGTIVSSQTLVQEGYGEDSDNNYVYYKTATINDSPSGLIDATARSLVRVINQSSTIVDASYDSSSTDVPGKMTLEALAFDTTPFLVVANTDALGSSFSPDIGSPVSSENEVCPNRIYYSKTNEPEHVPKLNYIDIGPKDKAIIRVVGLQDSLFIFKEEGIYRLIGENSTNFSVKLHDSSGIITAPDSITVLNNQIYCYTTQGIVSVSEAGMSIISRPIENIILRTAQYQNFSTATFSLSSETDRTLLVFTPNVDSDTSAKVAYRYNIFTRAWTTNTREAACGVLNSATNKFFLGDNDSNIIDVERKTYTRRDFANRQYTKNLLTGTKIGNSMTLSSTSDISKGDVLIQTQYLTISQFNRLLGRLDIDPIIRHPTIIDYFSQSAAVAGDDLNDNITELVTKLLVRDAGGGYSYTPSSSFATMQTNYNGIITDLNASTGAFFTNYEQSTGTIEYEQRIDLLNTSNNVITSTEFLPLIVGEVVVHNYIPIDVIWAPNHFGDPSTLKHVRESTIMFEDTSFVGATYGFNTDLSANYESVDFSMTGDGLWGSDHYDTNPWGGSGQAVPFRTWIPKQKQRCRFIRARFQNKKSFTKFAILGISYTFEVTSERAYK